WLFTGAGRLPELARLSSISCIVNVAVSLGATVGLRRFAPSHAFLGPLLGTTTIFIAIQPWWMLALMRRHFQVSPIRIGRAALVPLAIGVPYTGALLWLT